MSRRPTDIQTSNDAKNFHGISWSAELVHAKDSIGIVFVADFVNAVPALFTHVKSIWAIDHNAILLADVLVSVNNSFRHDDRLRIVFADDERHHVSISFRVRPIVPHAQFEIRRTKKTKQIGLVDVLVRAARHAGISRRDISHYRKEFARHLIVTKHLA